jgi:hypothetical protein
MSNIPHAFSAEDGPGQHAQSASQPETRSDAEVVAAAVANESARMQGVVEREKMKGKGVEVNGDANMYAAHQWFRVRAI